MLGSSWIAAQLAASQEGLIPMKLVLGEGASVPKHYTVGAYRSSRGKAPRILDLGIRYSDQSHAPVSGKDLWDTRKVLIVGLIVTVAGIEVRPFSWQPSQYMKGNSNSRFGFKILWRASFVMYVFVTQLPCAACCVNDVFSNVSVRATARLTEWRVSA
jgi:hypothetical protein